ncbi:MAG: sugar phosphate isomerase/epimerase family protein [Enterocloster bolteae]
MGTISKSQVAIGNYHYVAYSFDYFLNSVKSIGAENIELWGAKPHFCVDDQNRESVREFRKRVEDKGLSLICFCPNRIHIRWISAAGIQAKKTEHRTYETGHRNHLMAGRWTGCFCARVTDMRMNRRRISGRDAGRPWKTCLGQQRSRGYVSMLETQSQEESLFMNTVYQQKEMMNQVDHPNLKAMLDTVQLAQFDQSVRDDIKILGIENVRHVHLGNTLFRSGHGMTRSCRNVLEGEGK